MIRAVIFDLDGVLIDSNHWHATALEQALSEAGYPAKVPLLFSTKKVMDGAGVPEDRRAAIVDRRWRIALRLMYQLAQPSIVTQFCLAALKVDGYQTLIASSSLSPFVMGAMWKTGIVKYIDGVLSGDMVTKRKPDPEIYRKAVESIRLSPTEALAVEDSDSGIASAQGAGVHTMKVHGVMGCSYQSVTSRIREIESGGEA